jgi:hypothetical protein
MRFAWFATQTEAWKDSSAGLSTVQAARWGIVDGNAVNWFQSFTPGAGAQRADGATVTLLRRDAKHPFHSGPWPSIEVQIAKGGQDQALWVPVNDLDPEALVRFEDFAALETVLRLNAFQDGGAVVSLHYRGKSCGVKVLTAGQTWNPEGAPYEIRLDRVLEKAVVVMPKDSTLYQAILRDAAGELQLRQGEAVRSNDLLLQFIRIEPEWRLRYDLTVVEDGSANEQSFSLSPGETVRQGDWRFSQAPPGSDPLHTAVLRADLPGGRSWIRVLVAVALALLVGSALYTRPQTTEPADR